MVDGGAGREEGEGEEGVAAEGARGGDSEVSA